jgi:hypothetical protein
MTADSESREYGYYTLPVLPPGVAQMEVGAMGRDAAVFAEPWFGVDGGRLPYPVYMRLGRDSNGRLAVVGLHIDGTEQWKAYGPRPTGAGSITARSLRDVGAATIDVLRAVAEYRLEDPTMELFVGPILDRAATPYAGVSLRPGRSGHPPEFYREVAKAYATVVREGSKRPYKALVPRLYRTESQVRRLVNRAWELFPELKPKDDGEP